MRDDAAGVTAIEDIVLTAAVTVIVAVPIMPPIAAVIVVAPGATAAASPVELIVATAVLELLQLTIEVMLTVEPSL